MEILMATSIEGFKTELDSQRRSPSMATSIGNCKEHLYSNHYTKLAGGV